MKQEQKRMAVLPMAYHLFLEEEMMAKYIERLEDDKAKAVEREDYELAQIKQRIIDWNVMQRPEYKVKPIRGHMTRWTPDMTLEAYPEIGLNIQ